MEVKVSLAALKDTNAQNMKARVFFKGECKAKGLDLDVRELVSERNIFQEMKMD